MDAPAVVGIEYGTLPDWIAAAGTSIATIVAILIINREVQARREARAAEFSHQARLVLCWLEAVEEDATFATSSGVVTASRSDYLAVVIDNRSEEPVFDCQVHVDLDQDGLAMLENIGRRRLAFTEKVIGPGASQHRLALPGEIRRYASAWLLFTDRNGMRWQRGSSGKLSRIVDPLERMRPPPRVGPAAPWYGPQGPPRQPTADD